MNRKSSLLTLGALVLVAALLAFTMQQASAHEGRTVGDYNLVFGWQVEPAYVGVTNGPELTITDHDSGDPIEGAEETLRLRVRFGPASRMLTLTPVWGEPGHYKATLTPTRAGDYTFELTGRIGTTTVRETFSSADGEFSTIEPASDILFPDADLDARSLQQQIDGLKRQIDALKATVNELTAD